MKLNTSETIRTKLDIKDSSKAVAIQIEAAHAGIMNGNYVFYTPKALREGVASLKKFFKPLQKKHYDKTLGFIYDATYVEEKETAYQMKINDSKTPEELGKAVKEFFYSDDYNSNPNGFGVLVSKAQLYDADKIKSLSTNDKGYVSIAGEATNAVCSICFEDAVACSHNLGERYGTEVCFAIVDELELDHISFEDIPANFKTNSLIITDSKVMGKVELISEGKEMNLTLQELKTSLENIDNILVELDLAKYTEMYKATVETAKGGEFLFPKEKLLPLNSKLGVIVATKILERLTQGSEKDTILQLLSKEHTKQLGEETVEDALTTLDVVETTATADPEEGGDGATNEGDPEGTPVVQPVLQVTDANQVVLQIVDSLAQLVDTKLQELESKITSQFETKQTATENAIYVDRIEALEQDLALSAVTEEQLVSELKASVLAQIVMLKQVDVDSDYFKTLSERSVKDLKMTLEDHKALQVAQATVVSTPVVEPEKLAVKDNLTSVDPTTAVASMDTQPEVPLTLVIEDADKVVTNLIAGLGDKSLDQDTYTAMYKSVATEHGLATAKKLHVALKQQFKI